MEKKTIGICDSGVGGLFVLESMLEHHPYYNYVYIADQINAPYGDSDYDTILSNSKKIMNYFESRDIDEVIIACNTMCSTVINDLHSLYPRIKFHSIIAPTCNQLNDINKDILVIATNATVKAHAYKTYINENYEGKNVYELACPKFVPLIENEASEEELQLAVNHYLNEYVDKVDTIILGCTHYPVIKPQINNCFDVKIYDSNSIICNEFENLNITEKGELEIYTTKDEEEMIIQIKKLFKKEYLVKFLKLN